MAGKDWRMPNIKELRSIVDYAYTFYSLTIDHTFINLNPGHYWVSTSRLITPNATVPVNMGFGMIDWYIAKEEATWPTWCISNGNND